LGAGSAGQGLASYLSLKGYRVNLFNRSPKKIDSIRKQGGIETTGVVEGFAKISKISTEVGEVVRDTDVIILTARAYGHKGLLELCAPHLKDSQTVLVMTGYWFCLRSRNVIEKLKKRVTFAETTLLPLASEIIEPGKVKITGIKSKMRMAAFPSDKTTEALSSLKDAIPQLFAGSNVIETNLENFNPIFHTPISLFNLGEIERKKDFKFYHQGVTLKIAEVIDAIDREKQSLIEKMGLDLGSSLDILRQYYATSGESTYELIHNCEAWKGYVLPNIFDYVREDVLYGLVPIASLCELLGLPNENIMRIVSAWSLIDKVNYLEEGITADHLGFSKAHPEQIIKFVSQGNE